MAIRILVAIQNATPGAGTLALASDWANRLDGSVMGVGIIDESIGAPASLLAAGSASSGNIAIADVEALRSRASKGVERALRELEEHCRWAGIEYRQVTGVGNPPETIGTEAQRCDVVLIGEAATPDREFGVPARAALEGILRTSPRPIVVVPSHIQNGHGILVAYDGSLQAARALQALVASGLTGLGAIRIVGVHRDSAEAAGEHALRAVDYLAIHGVKADSEAIVSDKAAERVIVDEAQARGVELICMGAHGRSRLAEFLLGSITSKVIDAASAPVFLYH